jgi:SNF family Na+-dependent transporter
MFILLIRGLTLEGSENGIDFFFKINDINEIFNLNVTTCFERLDFFKNYLFFKIWVEAAIQIFFSLGPGFGTIIALSSYNKKSNNCYKDAMLTSSINCFTSILSGLVVFTTLGHMAKIQNKRLEDVVEGGPGLVFVTYPLAISLMPFSSFWAVIFFFMLFTLGIDSTVSFKNI